MTERMDQNTELILGYVEGDLDDAQRAAFEEFLAQNHELRQLVSQLKLDRQALRGLDTQPAPVGLIDQVIQVHERAALLGDPAAPEPLPLSMPVHRWKVRRVLAYSGIAAVLLLSFGLVLQTLIPPGLLNRGSQLAKNQTGADASDDAALDVGSGLALLDEDRAYDEPDARAPGRQIPDQMVGREKSLASMAVTPPQSQLKKSVRPDSLVATQGSVDAERLPAEVGQAVQPTPGPAAASSNPQQDPNAARTGQRAELFAKTHGFKPGGATGGLAREQAESTQADSTTIGEQLALADTAVAADRIELQKDTPADTFAGYSGAPLTDRTQLRVNAPSPTQARRDIRNWAIANSARFVVEPPAITPGSPGSPAGPAPPATAGALGITGQGKAPQSRRARTLSTASTTHDARENSDAGGATRYLVVIDPQQVPDLLAYLNRAKGQHAELVTPAEESIALEKTPRLEATLTPTRASRDGDLKPAAVNAPDTEDAAQADHTEAPKAVANRLVDTQSGWDHGSLARGISPPAGSNRARQANEAQTESTDSARRDAKKYKEESKKEGSAVKQRQPSIAFDWSRWLEPKQPLPAKSTAQRPSDPITEPRKQVRLEVIIQQVADEVSVGQADAGSEAESNQTEQSPPRDTPE